MRLDFKPIPNSAVNKQLKFLKIQTNKYKMDYAAIQDQLLEHRNKGDMDEYYTLARDMAKNDFFFLCYFLLELPVNDPFLIARIYEVEKKHDKTLDLWAREHWKSTILTFALVVWQFIHDPNERICIFSHTRQMAKKHMRAVMLALETNKDLLKCFSDVFFENPRKETKWSEDDGLYVKRTKVFKEPSLSASGLVDGLPTGSHFSTRIYDDIIDMKNVNTLAQQEKAERSYQQSQFLGTRGGQTRAIGTRYHTKDIYGKIMYQRGWKARVYPAEVDDQGKAKHNGLPVYLTREELDDKLSESSEFEYSSQMLQNPVAISQQTMRKEWIRYYDNLPPLNLYCIIDAASTKKKSSDYTVMAVVGVDYIRNYYLVDMIRDKLSMGEKWEKLKELMLKHKLNECGYEQYGAASDIEYMTERQDADGIYFNIIQLKGNVPKADRIKRLHPLFRNGRFLLPQSLVYDTIGNDRRDLIEDFIQEEYTTYPFSKHDDILDALARILDSTMNVTPPKEKPNESDSKYAEKKFDPLSSNSNNGRTTWMSV